jgi:hypothetical protein
VANLRYPPNIEAILEGEYEFMSAPPEERYLYSGHTVGASAQFHRLDNVENLNHRIPALGASVLPVTGGLATAHVTDYSYVVDHPRHRTLLSVRRVDSSAEGREYGDRFETEVGAEVESIRVVEKLHVDFIKFHMLSTLEKGKAEPTVSTRGNEIEGMRLGRVKVKLVLDEEPLGFSGSKEQLAAFYKDKKEDYRLEHSWRFGTPKDTDKLSAPCGMYTYSLVREIKLQGTEVEKHGITVEGYSIKWKGFGRIVLGEVVLRGNSRQVTLVRLAMGSSAGGPGSMGCGQTNGQLGSS